MKKIRYKLQKKTPSTLFETDLSKYEQTVINLENCCNRLDKITIKISDLEKLSLKKD